MSDYRQPHFYRFNEDSLKLVNFVSSNVKTASHILDLGAGSGIIGIELANRLGPKELTLLDIQEEWLEYLSHNVKNYLVPEVKSHVIIESFGKWKPAVQYDLIVSNPPYYLPGHGQPNSDKRKEIARSFVKDDWQIFLGLIKRCLAPSGKAFIVVKNDSRIKKELVHDLDFEFMEEDTLLFVKISATACK